MYELYSAFLQHTLIPLLLMFWHISAFLCQYLWEQMLQVSCISAIHAQLADVGVFMRTVRLQNQTYRSFILTALQAIYLQYVLYSRSVQACFIVFFLPVQLFILPFVLLYDEKYISCHTFCFSVISSIWSVLTQNAHVVVQSLAPPEIFHRCGQMGPLKILGWDTKTKVVTEFQIFPYAAEVFRLLKNVNE